MDQCRKNPVTTGGAKLWDPNSSKLKKTWINVQGAPFSLKPNRLITLMYYIYNLQKTLKHNLQKIFRNHPVQPKVKQRTWPLKDLLIGMPRGSWVA